MQNGAHVSYHYAGDDKYKFYTDFSYKGVVRVPKLGCSMMKLDDVIAGFVENICKHPERLAKEPHTGWSRVLVKAFPPDIPPMRIWFTYDDDNIYIEHIEALGE
jgi:hypothetical protein